MKTLTVDDHQCIRLPDVKPRQVFAHEKSPDGRIILTPVDPVEYPAAKVRFVKENGRTVAETDQPISLEAIKEALAEFP
jgi:hypothetical protein